MEYKLDLELKDLAILDRHLSLFELHYGVILNLRGDTLYCDDENKFKNIINIINCLKALISKGILIDDRLITQLMALEDNNDLDKVFELYKVSVGYTFDHKRISPKTLGQLDYCDALNKYDIVFCSGPAGCGKTYLAVVYAVNAYKEHKYKRIILTRPAVEAGESLGFLPGDLKEKVDPYLRPLYDALDECFGKEMVERLIEKGDIEIAPLAYMRGRTLEDAIVILDEGQNTTTSQMKMFLTRLGFHSKMIVTGDTSQIDLRCKSGLISALEILKDIKEIKCLSLKSSDVIRHPLVKEIIDAYSEKGF